MSSETYRRLLGEDDEARRAVLLREWGQRVRAEVRAARRDDIERWRQRRGKGGAADDDCDRLIAENTLLKAALVEIANHATVERNPDGVDQAAHTMQLIAADTLQAIAEVAA